MAPATARIPLRTPLPSLAGPADLDARFAGLRARGAFLVAAQQTAGKVPCVTITSEKGRDCTVLNPWPTSPVKLTRSATPAETVSGKRFTFKTKPQEQILLRPAK